MPSDLQLDSAAIDNSSAQTTDYCPLCKIPREEVLAEFQSWKLARTKTMKGHRERLMLFHREHVRRLDEGSIGQAYMLLVQAGSKYFSFAEKWAVFEPVYATVPDHWHRVASDLDSSAEDHEQILKTPRMIIDNVKKTILRVEAAGPMDNESELKVSGK